MTMTPLVESLGYAMSVMLLWWSLALGARLMGDATLIGASANVVVATLAERSGHPIHFWRFLLYGVPTTVLFLILPRCACGFGYLR